MDRINFEKKKIAQDELDDLNHMIGKLKKLVPTTENEIDRHYYYCYGEGSVQPTQTGGVVVYIVKGERFGEYIHSAYGKTVKIPALRGGDVHLRRVDVFGNPWTDKFGYPLVNTSLDGRLDVTFGSDFHCLNPSASHKGYGSISKIDAGSIYVNGHDGSQAKLNIGSCSRIEATS